MDLFFQPEPVAWVQRAIGLGHPTPFRILSELGITWGTVLGASLALWLFGRRVLYALLTLMVAEAVVKKAISASLGVQRPSAGPIVKYEQSAAAAFPSGHVTTATTIWTYLGGATRFPLLLGIVLALAVAVARLYLGVHYVADVLGGLALGGFLAWTWVRVGGRVVDRLESWAWKVWLGLTAAGLAGVVAAFFFYVGQNRSRWNTVAMIAGLLVALPLEWRFVGHRPPKSRRDRIRVLLVGGTGLLLPFVGDMLMRDGPRAFGAAMVLVATLWGLLLAPALFSSLGWCAADR